MTRRDRALLAAVAAGRCHLAPGPFANLLVDHRAACDQLAAQRLLTDDLIKPVPVPKAEPTRVELTPAGVRALRLAVVDR